MRQVAEGSQAVAEAVRLAKVQVIAAYPITPQTHIVEFISAFCSNGTLNARFICVESEHSALAAILGGTQSLHTNAVDEALSLPGERTARLALRTQQVLAHESGVADVIDPLGGAPFIEELTDELEKRALELMARVDEVGGAVAAVEGGLMQRAIHRSALAWQRDIESDRRIQVGVNAHEIEEEPHSVSPDSS